MKMTTTILICFTLSVAAYADNTWVKARESTWQPDNKTLTNMQHQIEKYVKNHAIKQQRELLNWSQYSFQYLAIETEGQKHILVNGLCKESKHKTPDSFYLVFDGGNCYFSLKYDPASNRYSDLFINGPG